MEMHCHLLSVNLWFANLWNNNNKQQDPHSTDKTPNLATSPYRVILQNFVSYLANYSSQGMWGAKVNNPKCYLWNIAKISFLSPKISWSFNSDLLGSVVITFRSRKEYGHREGGILNTWDTFWMSPLKTPNQISPDLYKQF